MRYGTTSAQSAIAHPVRQLPPHAPRSTQKKPAAAYRQRVASADSAHFSAPELWYPSRGPTGLKIVEQQAGEDYFHPVSAEQVRQRLARLPEQFTRELEVVQFSRMTRKRRTFPCYGMQWGQTIYLYPIESSLVELYCVPPKPAQQIEARQFGAVWGHNGADWTLTWTPETLQDFYLNNVLIHELGHLNDPRNTSYRDRERYANWFAIEYGFRPSRGRC